MCPDQRANNRTRSPLRRMQSGASVVTAIFLLLLMAGLGALMVTLSTAQHAASAQDLQGSRAYQAARAGLEWGIYRAVRGAGICDASAALPALDDDLAPFRVIVECRRRTHTEAGEPVTVFRIVSTASSGEPGSASRVERRIEATGVR